MYIVASGAESGTLRILRANISFFLSEHAGSALMINTFGGWMARLHIFPFPLEIVYCN